MGVVTVVVTELWWWWYVEVWASSLMVGLGVGAGFERTTKMESENESENDHFCKSKGRAQFFKNDHFWVYSQVILKSILEK